ncbi:MAG: type II secretion system protein [Myxococcota bacterium]|nr:type II secretion system protein [Myxococcota bacterium]
MSDESTPRTRSGFTLVELLVVIAIIAVLVALLLPRAGDERTRFNAQIASDTLQAIVDAAEEKKSRDGAEPTSLADLLAFCALPDVDCDLDPALARGTLAGHEFSLVDGCTARAEPVAPGLTGNEIQILGPGVSESLPAPGADGALAAALVELVASGFATLRAAIALDPIAVEEALRMGDLPGTAEVTRLLDANGDGLTIGEILSAPPLGDVDDPDLLGDWLAEAIRILAIGAGNESILGLSLAPPAPGPTDPLLAGLDGDDDRFPDSDDNCRDVANPGQEDVDAGFDDDSSLPGIQQYGDACDRDLDDDGLVGPSDFFSTFRPCLGALTALVPACAPADFDGDGSVAPNDFFGFLRPDFGNAPGPGIDDRS